VVALPIWIDYMEKVLKGVPESPRTVPAGVVSAPTLSDPGATGEVKTIPEFFYREAVPPPALPESAAAPGG
jgi:penicillin-binding protein 1A